MPNLYYFMSYKSIWERDREIDGQMDGVKWIMQPIVGGGTINDK